MASCLCPRAWGVRLVLEALQLFPPTNFSRLTPPSSFLHPHPHNPLSISDALDGGMDMFGGGGGGAKGDY